MRLMYGKKIYYYTVTLYKKLKIMIILKGHIGFNIVVLTEIKHVRMHTKDMVISVYLESPCSYYFMEDIPPTSPFHWIDITCDVLSSQILTETSVYHQVRRATSISKSLFIYLTPSLWLFTSSSVEAGLPRHILSLSCFETCVLLMIDPLLILTSWGPPIRLNQ